MWRGGQWERGSQGDAEAAIKIITPFCEGSPGSNWKSTANTLPLTESRAQAAPEKSSHHREGAPALSVPISVPCATVQASRGLCSSHSR